MSESTEEKPYIIIPGATGNNYQFRIYEWETLFNPICAVYVVLSKSRHGIHTLLYAGQTDDLSCRFDFHHKQACFDQQNKTHVGILVEKSREKGLLIKADLIDGHKPVCNC
ncbi:MAG: hypothetical protein GXP08_08615 [Gammaproteobacteria bacterium]|nr:hypothetical protein [Gammaproteobacteria bacterium]